MKMFWRQGNTAQKHVINMDRIRGMSIRSFLSCSNILEKDTLCNYIRSKSCILIFLLVGLFTVYALWSIFSRKRDSNQMISEKQEDILVARLLDRLKNNEKSNSKKINDAVDTNIKDPEIYGKHKEHYKEKSENEKGTLKNDNTQQKMNKSKLEVEIEKVKKKGNLKQSRYSESHLKTNKKSQDPNTIEMLTIIENHIKMLELKIQNLVTALEEKGNKSPKLDSKSLIKNLSSVEETLKTLKKKSEDMCQSSTLNTSLAEKLVGIEDFLNEISQTLNDPSNHEIKKDYKTSQNAIKTESLGNIKNNEVDENLNNHDTLKPHEDTIPPNTTDKNFRDDLNKLLIKYFGDQLAYEYDETTANNIDIKEYFYNDKDFCEAKIKKVAQLARELEEMCVHENTKNINKALTNDVESITDTDKTLDPDLMTNFKKDLKDFLRNYFKDELREIDRKEKEIKTKSTSQEQRPNIQDRRISMESEIMEVIEKELTEAKQKETSKSKQKNSAVRGKSKESESPRPTEERTNDVKAKPTFVYQTQDDLKRNQLEPRTKTNENNTYHDMNENEITKLKEEFDVERRDEHLVMNDFKSRLENLFNDRFDNKSEVNSTKEAIIEQKQKLTDKPLTEENPKHRKAIDQNENPDLKKHLDDKIATNFEEPNDNQQEMYKSESKEIQKDLKSLDFDPESTNEIRAVLLGTLMKRMENETKKFRDQLRIDLLEKILEYLTSKSEKLDNKAKEHLINKIAEHIDNKLNKSKEQLKAEFTAEIKERLSKSTKESQDEIRDEIIKELERQFDKANFDMDSVKNKKSLKNLFKFIGKALPNKNKKDLLSDFQDFIDEDLEQGLRKEIIVNISKEIRKSSDIQRQPADNAIARENSNDTKASFNFVYQLGITEKFKNLHSKEVCKGESNNIIVNEKTVRSPKEKRVLPKTPRVVKRRTPRFKNLKQPNENPCTMPAKDKTTSSKYDHYSLEKSKMADTNRTNGFSIQLIHNIAMEKRVK